jgi:hypothetical protein
MYLPCISSISPAYLPCISPVSARGEGALHLGLGRDGRAHRAGYREI